MTALAARTNATLPRLSHAVRRLVDRGLVARFPCSQDGRATNARLTEAGWQKVSASAPGHVDNVQHHVFEVLSPEQVTQLAGITDAILDRLRPRPCHDRPVPRSHPAGRRCRAGSPRMTARRRLECGLPGICHEGPQVSIRCGSAAFVVVRQNHRPADGRCQRENSTPAHR